MTSPATAHVVVVGAGLGGLAAACHLRAEGHDVTVIEAAGEPGGRAGTITERGYTFQAGPVVLTMPDLVKNCFRVLGADPDDHLRIRPVDPMYRAQFADGSTILVRHGREAMTAEIAATCGPADAGRFEEFCDWLTQLYELEMPTFIDRNYDSPLDLLRNPAAALGLVRLGGFRRLAPAIGRRFADPRLQRLFSFQSLYAGLAPHDALAIFAVITYMDSIGGVFTTPGGMAAVPHALAEAARQAGVVIRLGERVEQIVLADGTRGRVLGVRVAGGEMVPADAVVANADLPAVYDALVPGLRAPRAVRRGTYSPSALVWHVGTRGALPPGTAHHNIHFGAAWDEAFRELIDEGRCMSDPSLLVSVPTIDEPQLAPPGRHTLYVLEPVPNLDGRVDWTVQRQVGRDRLAARLAALDYPVDPKDIEVESLVDPRDWQAAGLARGTPFSLAHRFTQSGPFRPRNVDRRAPGLVLCGCGTTPGVGVPMVLVSGRLAAERVSRHLVAGRR